MRIRGRIQEKILRRILRQILGRIGRCTFRRAPDFFQKKIRIHGIILGRISGQILGNSWGNSWQNFIDQWSFYTLIIFERILGRALWKIIWRISTGILLWNSQGIFERIPVGFRGRIRGKVYEIIVNSGDSFDWFFL